MRRLPPLSMLRAFEAAARHLSFKRAALELAVTPTAISHQIGRLEEHLGVPLFERRARRVALTAPGKTLFPALRDGLDSFADVVDSVRAGKGRRHLTLSATTAFTAKWLVPRVASFRAAHPDLDLRLHASDELVDLAAGTVDAAIRYGRGIYPGLESEELIVDRFAPLCSPRLGISDPGQLRAATLIHFEWKLSGRETPVWRRWFAAAGLRTVDPAAGVTFSDESHAIQAAVAGQGVALLSLVLVSDELASGALVQPFGPVVPGYRYHLVYRKDHRERGQVALLRDWIRGVIN
jgi:LysR family glycine cleavage system transcriptional activator